MQAAEYISQPTSAAIDSALARAMSGESSETETQSASSEEPAVASRLDDFVGRAGSYERGFVFTAGLIVAGLLAGRLLLGPTTILSVGIPLVILAGLVTPRIVRGLPIRHPRINTRGRILATALAFPPYLFRIANDSFSRTEKSAIVTSWAASIIGLAAVMIG